MLTAIRKNAPEVEEYTCRTCGRPLLRADSPCPKCYKDGMMQHVNVIEENGFSPAAAKKTNFMLDIFLPLLWMVTGTLGLTVAVYTLLTFHFFESFVAFGLSVMLVTGAFLIRQARFGG